MKGVRVLSQALMELEVAQHLGAERYQRSPERQGERNGYRERTWDTRVGSLELRVPRVRAGSFFPSLLEPRKRAERALVATVREAYVQGVSTRRVDDLVKALGLDGIAQSQLSGLCPELDTEVERFRTRTLEGSYPSCWRDATFRQDAAGPPRGQPGRGLLALATVKSGVRVIPRRLLLIATYGLGIGMAVYGVLGLVVDGLRLMGVLAVPPSAWISLRWHVFVWDPWWIVGGALFLVAARLVHRHARGA